MNDDGILESKKINMGAILSGIALLLVISICIALYLGAHEEIEERPPAEGEVTLSEMEDYLHKLTYLVGPRDLKTPSGQKSLRSVAAMIDGTLGTANTGFPIFQKTDPAEGLLWRTLWIETGDQESSKIVIVTVPYGLAGHEVAFALGFGEYLTKHRPNYKLKLVFHPPLAEYSRTWLKNRVVTEKETLIGIIGLRAAGADTKWATLFFNDSANAAPVLREMRERRWLENLHTPTAETILENDIELRLHLDDISPRDGTATRFLRMLPVTKLIADTLAQ